MRRASIDIGSNSVLLLAVEINSATGVIEREILNESFITSLGKDLDVTKKFHPDSIKATYEALSTYKKLLDQINFPVADVIATATEASRVSTNSREFFKKIKDELGFNIQIISSDGEAYYTALGVISSVGKTPENIVVMDIGGASTELIQIQTEPVFKIISSISLPVGSVRATDWKTKGEFDTRINEILGPDITQYQVETLVCVAGSMTALASMYLGQREYSDTKIEGMKIPFSSFQDFSRDLQNTTVENLLLLFPFLQKRAPMVAGGSHVAELIASKLKIKTMKISTRGLRYGTVVTGGIDEQFIGK
jgi:exopolyphosphatase/guanosine-5'-triphosphate,3'-diphosphate pyrophosphatase